jgi:hypothetical protein
LHLVLDCSSVHMDYSELHEIQRALRGHDDVIQGNRSSIIMTITKIHEQNQHVTTQIATIMGIVVQLKH